MRASADNSPALNLNGWVGGALTWVIQKKVPTHVFFTHCKLCNLGYVLGNSKPILVMKSVWRSAPCSQSPIDCMSSHQPSVLGFCSLKYQW